MEAYDHELDHTVPEARYDMVGYGSGFPVHDQPPVGMGYPDYEWSRMTSDPSRHVFTIPENVDPQCHPYLGFPQHSQPDVMQPPHYLSPGDVAFAPPLGHMGFGATDSLYNPPHQGLNAVSPSGSSSGNSSSGSGGSPGTCPGQKPKRKRVQSAPQRKAANIRERRRMFHLNEAFDTLRKRLPAFNYEKRLSRIETLRLAMTYIAFMKNVSDGQEPEDVKLVSLKCFDESTDREEGDTDTGDI